MKIINKYQVNDGTEFYTEKKAHDFLIDKAGIFLEEKRREGNADFRHKDFFNFALAMIGDYKKLKETQKFFNDLLGFEEIERDEDFMI